MSFQSDQQIQVDDATLAFKMLSTRYASSHFEMLLYIGHSHRPLLFTLNSVDAYHFLEELLRQVIHLGLFLADPR